MAGKKSLLEPAQAYKVLCIGDDSDLETYKNQLCEMYNVSTAKTLNEALDIINSMSLDSIVEDMTIEDIAKIKSADATLDVIHVMEEKNSKTILEAAMAGASGYLVSPYDEEELVAVMEMIRRNKNVRDKYDTLVMDDSSEPSGNFIGVSPAFIHIIAQAARLKGHEANVLITGESGTGKEMMARFIHELEGVPKRPFVAINCAAIPENLIESELFGHEKGAFTGATQRKLGKFEMAGGGDIFLDEISTLKPELQAKILRVIEEKTICRIGDTAHIDLEFRVIAASNENLEEMVKEGTFRLDLYHRLKVVEFRMPPLRARVDDIPVLIDYFLRKHDKLRHKKAVSAGAVELLKKYSWPGNIRELENLIHNLIIMAPNGSIEESDIPAYIADMADSRDEDPGLDRHLARAKKSQIEETLARTGGNKSEAARLLGISRATINNMLKEKS